MSYDEFDDEIEISYNGTKIIQAERHRDGPTGFDVSPIAGASLSSLILAAAHTR